MVEHVAGDQLDALRGGQEVGAVNVIHLLIGHPRIQTHRLDVIHLELEHVAVVDGMDDGVAVQRSGEATALIGVASEEVGCGLELAALAPHRVHAEDGGACEAEEVVALEGALQGTHHVAKLRAVALINDDDHLALQAVYQLLLPSKQCSEFLYRGDDDAARRVAQLPQEDGRRGVAVGAVLLQVVVLLHRLVVEVLAVHHEEHLLDVGLLRGQLCGLEAGERLAAARGVPDVATAFGRAVEAAVVGILDAVEDALRGRYLVGAHHQEVLIDGEDAVARQYLQQVALGQEGGGKVGQGLDAVVVGIGPVARELEAVALRLDVELLPLRLAAMGIARGVAIVLGERAVADDEELHVLEEPRTGPEALTPVAVDLIEGLAQTHPTALQLDVEHGEAVDQQRHVVAVGRRATLGGVLVDYLEVVVVYVVAVEQPDIHVLPVVEGEAHDGALLHHLRLLLDAQVLVGDVGREESAPLCIAELELIEPLNLSSEVVDELGLSGEVEALVALLHELLDKGLLQGRFALVASLGRGHRLIAAHHGAIGLLGDDVRLLNHDYMLFLFLFQCYLNAFHTAHSSKVNSFSR